MNTPYEDSLHILIRTQLAALPIWCKGEGPEGYSRASEYHEWVPTYGHGNALKPWLRIDRSKTIQFPYYLCKHCHAVSNDFTTSDQIKRVR